MVKHTPYLLYQLCNVISYLFGCASDVVRDNPIIPPYFAGRCKVSRVCCCWERNCRREPATKQTQIEADRGRA
jgi:hypothetical protein